MDEQILQPGNDTDLKNALKDDVAEVNKDPKKNMENETPPIPNISKRFKLKHVFKKISKLEDGKRNNFLIEEHFGHQWCLLACRSNGYLNVIVGSLESISNNNWTVELIPTINAVTKEKKFSCFIRNFPILGTESKIGGISSYNFIKWEDLNKNPCVVKDSLTIEAEIVIKKTTRGGRNLREFGESMKKFSDVALIVQDQKFYVSKLFLATHSPYFNSLFFGSFKESQQSEVHLHDIDPYDFQKYLEVLYGEDATDDRTVEGILLIADSNDTKIVKQK